MKNERLSIDMVACRFGISYRTLRFYEERGIVSPERQGSKRLYSEQDCVKLEIVFKGKKLGFGLSEIEGLIGAVPPASGDNTFLSEDVLRSLGLEGISEKIAGLELKRSGVEEAIDDLSQVLSQRRIF